MLLLTCKRTLLMYVDPMTPISAPSTDPMMDQFLVLSALVLSFSWLARTPAENKANFSRSDPSAFSYAVRRRRSSYRGEGDIINKLKNRLHVQGHYLYTCPWCGLTKCQKTKPSLFSCVPTSLKTGDQRSWSRLSTFSSPAAVCAPAWRAPGSELLLWRPGPGGLGPLSDGPAEPPSCREPRAPSLWTPWTLTPPGTNTRRTLRIFLSVSVGAVLFLCLLCKISFMLSVYVWTLHVWNATSIWRDAALQHCLGNKMKWDRSHSTGVRSGIIWIKQTKTPRNHHLFIITVRDIWMKLK